MLRVDAEIKQAVQDLSRIRAKAIPYAWARAANRTAFALRRRLIRSFHVSRPLTNRQFARVSLRVRTVHARDFRGGHAAVHNVPRHDKIYRELVAGGIDRLESGRDWLIPMRTAGAAKWQRGYPKRLSAAGRRALQNGFRIGDTTFIRRRGQMVPIFTHQLQFQVRNRWDLSLPVRAIPRAYRAAMLRALNREIGQALRRAG